MTTTSKEAQLKKQLIRLGIVIFAILGVLVSIGVYSYNYNDDMVSDQSTKQNQNNILSSQYREIETTLGIQNEVAAFYDNYSKNHNQSFVLDRDTIKSQLGALRKTNHLANLEVTISSISDIADTAFTLKSGKPEKSTVRIQFGALSDNSVYNFIYDLQHKLPGIVLISELKITKTGSITKDSAVAALNAAVSQHNIVSMVTGELTFTWIGIRPNETAAASENGGQNAK